MSTALVLGNPALAARVQRQAVAAVMVLIAFLFSLPFLVPVHRHPLTTFDSEWLTAGILAFAMIVAAGVSRAQLSIRWPLPAIALMLLIAAEVHYLLGALQYTYALSSLFIFMCALFSAYLLGRWFVATDLRARALLTICVGLLIGGLLSLCVQVLQVFDVQALPSWLVFSIVDKLSNRRPFANLAQPNQLATYLVWATIAAVYIARRGVGKRALFAAAAALFCGLAFTGSRMGSLFALVLLVLLLTPNAISPESFRDRVKLAVALALGYGAGLMMTRIFLVDASGVMPTAIERYGEGSFGQRLSMWSDAVRIALAHPWLGVGVGEYGGAQYLTANADPSLLPTSNPHNILLHIAAEFGLPVAAALLAIVSGWCWQRASASGRDPHVTVALALVLFLLAHSLLEYPLWYLYFIVPMGLLVGLAEPASEALPAQQPRARFLLGPIALAMLLASAVMKADYEGIVPIWQRYLQEVYEGSSRGPETIAGVMGTMGATYFRPQMERLYVELLPANAQQGDENLALVARVQTRLADLRVIVRHILLLLQAERIDETAVHVARLKLFAGPNYPILRAEIEESIAKNGAELDAFRRMLQEP